MKLLIAGCGYVGKKLAENLLSKGHQVTTINRTLPSIAGAQTLALDLGNPSCVNQIPHDFDAVFFTASATGQRNEDAYRAIYHEGLRNTMRVAESCPSLNRMIFTSSTAVYGQKNGEWVDEDSPTLPARFNGKLMLEAEQILLESPLPGSVVRLSGIYGPGRDRMIRRVRDGEPPPRTPPAFLNHIHRDDAASLLEHILQLDDPDSLYLGSDNEPTPYAEALPWLADQLKVPTPLTPTEFSPTKRCSNKKVRDSGYSFIFPTWREGYASLINQEN